jgi:hypothetical protein
MRQSYESDSLGKGSEVEDIELFKAFPVNPPLFVKDLVGRSGGVLFIG